MQEKRPNRGGGPPAIPMGEPTDLPRQKPGTEKGPVKQDPTV